MEGSSSRLKGFPSRREFSSIGELLGRSTVTLAEGAATGMSVGAGVGVGAGATVAVLCQLPITIASDSINKTIKEKMLKLVR